MSELDDAVALLEAGLQHPPTMFYTRPHSFDQALRTVLTALAEAHTKAFEEAREAAAVLLDERIAQGYPTPPHKVEQCQHGKFGWEDCIACYDDALLETLGAIRSLQPTGIWG